MAAECGVPVGAEPCGIQAIGRCNRCGSAFCLTHQARASNGTAYVDLCATCLASEQAAASAQNQEIGRAFVTLGGARRLLQSTGLATVEFHTVEHTFERRSLGRSRDVSTLEPKGTGWLIGTFSWKYNDGRSYGGSDIKGSCLTVLIDDDRWYQPYSAETLVRVEPDPENGGYLLQTTYGWIDSSFETVGRAIRDLVAQQSLLS